MERKFSFYKEKVKLINGESKYQKSNGCHGTKTFIFFFVIALLVILTIVFLELAANRKICTIILREVIS